MESIYLVLEMIFSTFVLNQSLGTIIGLGWIFCPMPWGQLKKRKFLRSNYEICSLGQWESFTEVRFPKGFHWKNRKFPKHLFIFRGNAESLKGHFLHESCQFRGNGDIFRSTRIPLLSTYPCISLPLAGRDLVLSLACTTSILMQRRFWINEWGFSR